MSLGLVETVFAKYCLLFLLSVDTPVLSSVVFLVGAVGPFFPGKTILKFPGSHRAEGHEKGSAESNGPSSFPPIKAPQAPPLTTG